MNKKMIGLLSVICLSANANTEKPETPAQIRRIVAQSLCLAVAYPQSEVSRDSEAVYALYAPLMNIKNPLPARQQVEKLAVAERPASPSPVGNHNLALAKCSLFAERLDVQKILGANSRKP